MPYFVADVVADLDALIAAGPANFAPTTSTCTWATKSSGSTSTVATSRCATSTAAKSGAAVRPTRDRHRGQPSRPSLPHADAAGIFGIQTIADGIACATTSLSTSTSARVVVGGGYIGLEMAEAMKRRGLTVTVVEGGAQPMSTLDPDMGALVADASAGSASSCAPVRVWRRSRSTTAVSRGRGRRRRGRFRPTSSCSGSASRPTSRLAPRPPASPSATTGAIATDRRMATSVEGVWAAGDCVETFHRVARPPGQHRARHAREQAGPRGRHQHRPAGTRRSPA